MLEEGLFANNKKIRSRIEPCRKPQFSISGTDYHLEHGTIIRTGKTCKKIPL